MTDIAQTLRWEPVNKPWSEFRESFEVPRSRVDGSQYRVTEIPHGTVFLVRSWQSWEKDYSKPHLLIVGSMDESGCSGDGCMSDDVIQGSDLVLGITRIELLGDLAAKLL